MKKNCNGILTVIFRGTTVSPKCFAHKCHYKLLPLHSWINNKHINEFVNYAPIDELQLPMQMENGNLVDKYMEERGRRDRKC